MSSIHAASDTGGTIGWQQDLFDPPEQALPRDPSLEVREANSVGGAASITTGGEKVVRTLRRILSRQIGPEAVSSTEVIDQGDSVARSAPRGPIGELRQDILADLSQGSIE